MKSIKHSKQNHIERTERSRVTVPFICEAPRDDQIVHFPPHFTFSRTALNEYLSEKNILRSTAMPPDLKMCNAISRSSEAICTKIYI